MKKIQNLILGILTAASLTACSSTSNSSQPSKPIAKDVPAFNADSAYQYIAKQLDFGPRVPGTKPHDEAAQWLENKLVDFGATTCTEYDTTKAYNGDVIPIVNIIGSFNQEDETKERILLISHWDCRPICDNDPDKTKYNTPVPSANDGASGVGILLELARQISQKTPKMGVDIFFTDAEDYGAPDDWEGEHLESWWALGTQFWCKNPHYPNYRAKYGILLDMVGAKDATFYREWYSDKYAQDIVNRVWSTAAKLGYGKMFIDQKGAGITDDHVFVNKMTGIPTIDIIDTRIDGDQTFFPYWHTSEDTMDKLSVETIGAVGNVLMNLIY